jgi:hypothetical protein
MGLQCIHITLSAIVRAVFDRQTHAAIIITCDDKVVSSNRIEYRKTSFTATAHPLDQINVIVCIGSVIDTTSIKTTTPTETGGMDLEHAFFIIIHE